MGIHSILEAFDDSSCFHYFIRKTMNQVSTKNTNKNKRSIHQHFCTCCISVLFQTKLTAKNISVRNIQVLAFIRDIIGFSSLILNQSSEIQLCYWLVLHLAAKRIFSNFGVSKIFPIRG